MALSELMCNQPFSECMKELLFFPPTLPSISLSQPSAFRVSLHVKLFMQTLQQVDLGSSDRFLACRKGHWQNSPAVKGAPSMKKDGCHILRCSKKEIRASRHTSIWAQRKTLNPQTQYPSPGKPSPTSKQGEHQHLLKIHLQFFYEE